MATIDPTVPAADLKDMNVARINLVVPAKLKADVEQYKNAPNVISFEYFFTYHLDPAMARWRASHVIK